MAMDTEQTGTEMRTVGKRLGAEVEALTGKKLADLSGFWAGDMVDRPVRDKRNGIDCMVIAQGRGESVIVVQAVCRVRDGNEPGACVDVGEPCELDLSEVVALCVHCWEPLIEAAFVGPGECMNSECFLCGLDEADGGEGRVY